MDRITPSEIDRLRALSDAVDPPPWTAMVEGRDHTSGEDFICVGVKDNRLGDIYVNRDSGPASAAILDLIAAARTHLPALLAEIDRLREALDEASTPN